MSRESHPQKRIGVKRISQIGVVFIALAAALGVVAYRSPAADFGAGATTSFDMLAYLDDQVTNQESLKDVRCWSSTCKLQMFLTGARIDPEAIAVRIQSHMKLVDSIWAEAKELSPGSPAIGADDVKKVLDRRFPAQRDSQNQIHFTMSEGEDPIQILPLAIKDYSDTIEAWRILQNWASRKTDVSGRVNLNPQFDQEALHVLYDFVLVYDLAVLQHARRLAKTRKLASIGVSAMSEAFQLEEKLRN